MPQYTFQQYEKFFDNFEGSNAGMIYKPRTFCSQRLDELLHIILHNIENEDNMKQEIINNKKLGECVVRLMYGDFKLLTDVIKTSTVGHPDFLDAIKLWREELRKDAPTDIKEVV
jgi:hypothetical protein